MIDVDSVVLDNVRYLVLEKLTLDNNTYYLISNINNDKDIKIGKVVLEDNSKYFSSIDDDQEFNKVAREFSKLLNN